jgi:putative restriction endonuclease
MNIYIGITDFSWYQKLISIPNIDEVNFWQPGGNRQFNVLKKGELFLFKLHSPRNFIVGGGFFAYSNILPLSLAWDSFAEKNGVDSITEMRRRIEFYRKQNHSQILDYPIGCILLEQPFFFLEDEWISIPPDWKSSIVQGKTYNTETELGKKLWNDVRIRLQGQHYFLDQQTQTESSQRYGQPTTIMPRLGQGSFRVIVTDGYNRRCAITQERTLPVLEAAHIKPYNLNGPHEISNGILLRSDLHKLLDKGYITFTPEHHLEVSRRIREEFENGRDYYALHGNKLRLPQNTDSWPKSEYLNWHNENVFFK